MLSKKPQVAETSDTAKLELYRLIGEGYKAMQEGRTSTVDEVREKLKKRSVANVVFTEPAEYIENVNINCWKVISEINKIIL